TAGRRGRPARAPRRGRASGDRAIGGGAGPEVRTAEREAAPDLASTEDGGSMPPATARRVGAQRHARGGARGPRAEERDAGRVGHFEAGRGATRAGAWGGGEDIGAR